MTEQQQESRTLARTVHIDGQVWRAGDTPPPEVAEKITNPAAWDADRAAATGNQASSQDRGGGTRTATGAGYDTGTKTGLPGGDQATASPPASEAPAGEPAEGEPATGDTDQAEPNQAEPVDDGGRPARRSRRS